MNDLVQMLFNGAGEHGFSTLLLFGCVWWLNKQNQKSEAGRQRERAARFDELNNRIVKLEDAVKECNIDRQTLRDKMIDLAARGHLSQPPSH